MPRLNLDDMPRPALAQSLQLEEEEEAEYRAEFSRLAHNYVVEIDNWLGAKVSRGRYRRV